MQFNMVHISMANVTHMLILGGIDVQAEYGDNPFVLGLSQETSPPTYDSIQVAPIHQSEDNRIE